MTYETIKEFFKNNGKPYDHATALHAYKNYEMYCKHNKNLELLFDNNSFDNSSIIIRNFN